MSDNVRMTVNKPVSRSVRGVLNTRAMTNAYRVAVIISNGTKKLASNDWSVVECMDWYLDMLRSRSDRYSVKDVDYGSGVVTYTDDGKLLTATFVMTLKNRGGAI